MKDTSKALVNNIQEFHFSQKELDQIDLQKQDIDSYHLVHNNKSVRLKVTKSDFLNRNYTIQINVNKYEVNIAHPLDPLIKKMGYTIGSSKTIDNIKAPMPGIIIELKVKKGQVVKKGETLLILEAMKMENAITCPKESVIKEIFVSVGDTVDKNKLLIDFE